jgi:hypothetical protein
MVISGGVRMYGAGSGCVLVVNYGRRMGSEQVRSSMPEQTWAITPPSFHVSLCPVHGCEQRRRKHTHCTLTATWFVNALDLGWVEHEPEEAKVSSASGYLAIEWALWKQRQRRRLGDLALRVARRCGVNQPYGVASRAIRPGEFVRAGDLILRGQFSKQRDGSTRGWFNTAEMDR